MDLRVPFGSQGSQRLTRLPVAVPGGKRMASHAREQRCRMAAVGCTADRRLVHARRKAWSGAAKPIGDTGADRERLSRAGVRQGCPVGHCACCCGNCHYKTVGKPTEQNGLSRRRCRWIVFSRPCANLLAVAIQQSLGEEAFF
jgi:hypothetical protein